MISNSLAFLRGDAGAERLVVLLGLRGVGKTTILLQLYQRIAGEGVPPERRLYLPCDRLAALPGASLTRALHAYEAILGGDLAVQTKKIFIFLDEAQYVPDWGLAVKAVHDEARSVQVVVSGSSALALRMNADVARRAVTWRVTPPGLLEYLVLTGRKVRPGPSLEELTAAAGPVAALKFFNRQARTVGAELALLPDLEHLVRRFLMAGSLPSTMDDPDLRGAWDKTYRLIERIVNVDLPGIGSFDRSTLRAAMQAITLVADSPDRSVQKMASELSLPPATVLSLMDALARVDLLLEVPVAGSAGRGARRKKRTYFAAPSMMAAVLDASGTDPSERQGPLLEAAVAGVLARVPGSSLHYDDADGGADFVLQVRVKIAVEVGWGSKGERQVRFSMARHRCPWGILVHECPAPFLSGRVVHVPVEQFLALG
ncbi:MAG: AAA family ATPase [Thermoplasmata archaeon]